MFPFFWQIITSFKPPEQIYKMPPDWFPSPIYFGSYIATFTKHPFTIYLENSLIVATATTLYSIVIGSLCAYAVARLHFKGKNFILMLVLTVSMFPAISILSPLYILLRDFRLLNTFEGLILPYTTHGLPLTIWILASFFKDIPSELEESARIDGTSRLGAFWRIIVPLAAPGVFTTAILVFIGAWNEFLFAFSFMSKDIMRTVPVGIAMFPGEHDLPWGDLSAASVIVTVPLIVMVLIFQRRIISGLTSGAVKG
ncbi:carbohydrate ABC transporter permease [Paenibacillus sp. yr247]|uniref:carbohydrate ABC transporter permease n=1 Tax=Paenibacillus sp. yr247 TaxID=1761880 RepID=UPI000B824C3B|nr:carbohydrate ABC transporter permease [Paenibacillus sp. yr247]